MNIIGKLDLSKNSSPSTRLNRLYLSRFQMHKPQVCVTLRGRSAQEMVNDAPRALEMGADLVEVRLDLLWTNEERSMEISNSEERGDQEVKIVVNNLDLEDVDYNKELEIISSNIETPLLLTCRPQSHGGFFPGDEEARIEILKAAISLAPSWIDLEIDIKSDIRKKLRDLSGNDTKVVASLHSMDMIPPSSEIVQDLQDVEEMGDFVKACYSTSNRTDALRIFEAALELSKTSSNYSLMGLGPGGDWTRIHGPMLGQYMVYATTESGWHLAQQGRINASDLRLAWDVLEYT